jgi:hypothetical protein
MLPVVVNGDRTVRAAEPDTPPDAADIVVTPGEMPVAKPPPVTVATAVADDVHEALPVSVCVLLSV